MEIWKDILDYEGLYQASNLGNVKSLAKSWVSGNGAIKIKNDTILKLCVDSRGYYVVKLCKNGKGKMFSVHRLIYEAFNGKTDLQIDHITEGNKLDNRIVNLQAISSRENVSKHYLTTNKSSKYTGVSWVNNANKWRSLIHVNGKKKHIGYFTSETDAAQAYQDALLSLNS